MTAQKHQPLPCNWKIQRGTCFWKESDILCKFWPVSHFPEILYCATYAHTHVWEIPEKNATRCVGMCTLSAQIRPPWPFFKPLSTSVLSLSTFAQNNTFPSCSCSLGTLPRAVHELCPPLPSTVFLMLEKTALGKGKEKRTSEPLALELCRKHSGGSFLPVMASWREA